MMRFVLALLAALTTPAFAQQPAPQSTAMEQALGGKLMEEINSNIQLRTQIVDLQRQVKDLEDKTKPK